MKKIFILISIFVAALTLTAQDGISLHFMRMNPYSKYTYPSYTLPYNGHVGFPGISNINAAFMNTSIHYKTLFGCDSKGTITSIKLNDLTQKLSNKVNVLNTNISLNIIDFGFRINKFYFDFSYRIRSDEYLIYNKDLINLPVHGNMYYAYENKTAKPKLSLNMNAYQEISFGIQAEITPQIYIGARPKILFGLAHARTKNANATLYTDPDDYSLYIHYNLDATLSCVIPYSLNTDSSGKAIMSFSPESFAENWQNIFKNVGAAIDLGFTYRINNMFGVSASILDLGFINWKTNNYHIHGETPQSGPLYNDESYIFNGLSTEDIQQISDNPQSFAQELQEYFPYSFDQTRSFTRMLAGRFMVEGYCNVSKYHRFSALFQGRIVNKQFLPSFTVAWNGNFLNIFDLCASYTISPKSYGNIGIGVGFNLGVFHLYAVTDNFLAFCTSKSPQRSLLNAKNANIQAGIVFDWGKYQEQKIEKKKKNPDRQKPLDYQNQK